MRPYPKNQREYFAPRPDDPTYARAKVMGRRFVEQRFIQGGSHAKVAWEPLAAYVRRKLEDKSDVWTMLDEAYWRGAYDVVIELDLNLEVSES